MTTSSKIQVIVRCRPFLGHESMGKSCVAVDSDSNNRITIGDKVFQFDHVFDSNSKQLDVYMRSISDLVEKAFEGYNGTIFAYGQTGSGKTYSIVGNIEPNQSNLEADDNGIIPRAIHDLFNRASQKELIGCIVNIKISFVEIYNEEFKDLLHMEVPSREIFIREDKDGKIFFTGAREESVGNWSEAINLLSRGTLARSTAETLMNATSSRSHAIFTISTEVFVPSSVQSDNKGTKMTIGGQYFQSKLHIVDLAGSERAKRTGAGGIRLKESVGINQGLLALGKVIRSLTSGISSAVHVPYRESKLTRFLQDSIGGNSRTVMLACISPSEINMHETLNTLQYASRTRSIQNKIVANVAVASTVTVDNSDNDIENNIINALKAQVVRMTQEISQLKNTSNTIPVTNQFKVSRNYDDYEYEVVIKIMKSTIDELEYNLSLIEANDITNSGRVSRVLDKLKASFPVWNDGINAIQSLISTNNEMKLKASNSHTTSEALRGSIQLDDYYHLKQQLSECKEDLKRDEEIFTEKIKELKLLRKQIRQLETERDDLKAIIDEMKRSQIIAYEAGMSSTDRLATESYISQFMDDLDSFSKDQSRLKEEKDKIDSQFMSIIEQTSLGQDHDDRPMSDRNHSNHQGSDSRPSTSNADAKQSPIHRQRKDIIESKQLQSENQEMKQTLTNKEFNDLNQRYQSLVEEYRNYQQSHEQDMNRLHSQLNEYKQNDDQLQSQMKILNNKNQTIRANYEKWLKWKGITIDPTRSLSSSMSFTKSLDRSTSSLLQSNKPIILINSIDIKHLDILIKKIINALIDIKYQFLEFIQINQKLFECELDSNEVKNELDSIINEKNDKETNIKSQLKEIKKKLKVILTDIKQYRNHDGNKDISTDSNRMILLKDAKAYQEHYDELLQRLDHGVLTTKQVNKLQELQEEMNAVQIEIQLHNQSLTNIRNTMKSHIQVLRPNESSEIIDTLSDMARTIARKHPQLTDMSVIPIDIFDRFIINEINHQLSLVYDTRINDEPQSNQTMNQFEFISFQTDLIKSLIDLQVQMKINQLTNQTITNNLHKRDEEYEQLVKTLQRNRSEGMKFQEQLKQESDQKIEFLLQQLKQAELRINQMVNTDDKNNEANGFEKPIVPYPNENHSKRSLHPNNIKDNSISSSSLNKIDLQKSKLIVNSPARSMEREYPDKQLLSYTNQQILSNSSDMTKRLSSMNSPHRELSNHLIDTQDMVDVQIYNEVVRRWQSEKERRVLLEQKTLELMKQLKSYKS